MDMGVKGAKEFKQKYKNAIFIYVIPPTKERLLEQMKDRNPSRLQRSKAQLPQTYEVCDWLVINDNLDDTAAEIERIMHIVKEHAHDFKSLDEDTVRFLFSHNFHNPKNKEFLEKFYGEDVSYPEEREV